MKPKHRVMCPDCKRQKMLFETESQALNFIKFNGDEVCKDGQELRVYYCPACCGYHITSKPYSKKYEGRTDRLIKAYKKAKAKEVMDEHDKHFIELKKMSDFVDSVFDKFMSDTEYESISKFITVNYPGMKWKEMSPIMSRVKHRQENDALEYWRSLPKDERNAITDKIAIRAVKFNMDELIVLTSMLKREYKMIPEGCISTIKDKCITIRDEMG